MTQATTSVVPIGLKTACCVYCTWSRRYDRSYAHAQFGSEQEYQGGECVDGERGVGLEGVASCGEAELHCLVPAPRPLARQHHDDEHDD
eukprot:382038-Rhodomonas_salina.1